MKIIKSIINVLTTLIIVFGVAFIGLYLFGITPYVVLSGSMEPNIKVGSVCFINKNVKYETIKEKDVIAFKMDDVLVTHRVVSKTEKGLITKGDANNHEDTAAVTSANYVGKNIFSIPKAGVVVKVIQSTTGKIVFGTVIVLLLAAGFLFGESDKKKPKEEKPAKEDSKENEE